MSSHPTPPGGATLSVPVHRKPSSFPLPIVQDNPLSSSESGVIYWRSLEERYDSPEYRERLAREFPDGVSELSGVGRRTFVQLLGATLALAGLQGCNAPAQKILPYTRQPALSPGTPVHYATALSCDGRGSGILVTSWEGRPTKVEGNPDHPSSLGASGTYDQAILNGLYDPSRARVLHERGQGRAWKTFLADVTARATALATDGGARLRFLLEPKSSPTLLGLRQRLLARFPNARFHSHHGLPRDSIYAGTKAAFGRELEPRWNLEAAKVIVSLDADFLQAKGEHLRHARQFANHRSPEAPMNRLYVVEPSMTVTGTMADHRVRLAPSDIERFARALLAEVARSEPSLAPAVSGPADVPEAYRKLLGVLAKDLLSNRGASMVVAGERQSAAVQAVAHALNAALGNIGKTVSYSAPVLPDPVSGPSGLEALIKEIDAGAVDTLVVTAFNPVYSSPSHLELSKRLSKVPNVIYLSQYEDETTPFVRWFVPAAHPLESWGDVRAADGTVSLVQPLIAPLFNGITDLEVLAAFTQEGDKSPYALVKQHWQQKAGPDFDSRWEGWLGTGVLPGSALPDEAVTLDAAAVAAAPGMGLTQRALGLEVAFAQDYKVYDGRFGNSPFLQELPDPVTKLTWDNAAYLSPATAARLKLEAEDVAVLELSGLKMEVAVVVAPGHADDTVTLPLGYGRKGSEKVADGVGFNAYLVRRAASPWFDRGASLSATGKKHDLAVTQSHWSMEGRAIALEATVAEHSENARKLETLRGPLPTMYEGADYQAVAFKWGMSIDLSRCTGCSACVLACQSENNIPVVGKEGVIRNREMHWLRIDRYFSGSAEDPGVITQPLACVHCESAPCEYVCPVNATVHSDEGLNEMVYNRCIGTRYCSNNCPYKVRRFNFLHYTGDRKPVEKLPMNPDVTVRARGVMEKCTYCVQRIERGRIDSRVSGKPLSDGDIQSACQQACPTQAIVFGSLHDQGAKVTQAHRDGRRYDLLHELNTKPRTAYLVRIRNPNPELA